MKFRGVWLSWLRTIFRHFASHRHRDRPTPIEFLLLHCQPVSSNTPSHHLDSSADASIDVAVIGAGVVGLACAAELARAGMEVVVIEAERSIGTGVSSRNSEVIHAGIYYPKGSLKARLCVEGKALLYAFCESHGVAHRRCGKLIVAQEAELQALLRIQRHATDNGVTDLQLLDRAAVHQLEPEIEAHAALLSPSTGIVDSHGLMLALQGEAERHGAMLALESRVVGGAVEQQAIRLQVASAGEVTPLVCRHVVNAAGLTAPDVAACISGFPQDLVPVPRYAKGHYFSLTRRAPFSRLIYPVPEPGGLGIHLTLDLGGQAKFGPNVQWVSEPSFDVDAALAGRFHAAVSRYWPALQLEDLSPAYAGVRPKIVGPDEGDADFRIDGPQDHGVPGLVQLFGIESPGLTSCLAIARLVRDKLS